VSRRSTGFPAADAADDFLRARRRHVVTRMGQTLRRAPADARAALSFDTVVSSLGRVSEHYAGLQTIPLDAVVGSVDKSGDYDRQFRPRSNRLRDRWQRIAAARRRGEAVPPIDVYRIGQLYFVQDGHHRVSVARALGQRTIDAYVTEVRTRAPAPQLARRGELLRQARDRVRRLRGAR
jgi:ParB-like nuclease family protein